MGTRAFSHDSIFIPEGQDAEDQETQAASQDQSVGKVKSLQQQLGKNIRFGQPPPAGSPLKRMQNLGATKEEIEETHNSTMDSLGERSGSKIIATPSSHGVRNVPQPEHKSEEKVTPVKSSRTKRPSGTIESINLDAVPRSAACLDNSAAKHKLAVKPKNQRVSKKLRGMSQDCYNIEDNEHEPGLNVHLSLNKAMYHSMDISNQDITVSLNYEPKAPGLQVPENTQVARGQHEVKKDWETKQEESVTFKSEESRHMDKVKKLEADKLKTEEEQRRQEIIKKIESERLQHKIREQKENEMKEQRRCEEEKKLRAEQILKEAEQRRQDEQRQREQEERRCLKLEEQKTCEQAQQRAVQQAEEQKKEREPQMEQQKTMQEAEKQKTYEAEMQKALLVAEVQKMCDIGEARALQEAGEQNKYKLVEHKILTLEEKVEKCETEQQKALQIAQEKKNCEVDQQKAIQVIEEQRNRELEQQNVLKIAEESKKEFEIAPGQRMHEVEQNKELQVEEQKRCELELQKTSQKSEEQKKHEEELQKSVLEEEGKRCDMEGQRAHKATEENKGLEVEGQKDKKFLHKELLQKSDPIIEDVKKNVDEPQHSSMDDKSCIIEKRLPEKPKTEEESKENDVDLKQRLINEELRWQELDQRQRPFTFKVTSGEKQMIFEKVNLSPVTLRTQQTTCPNTSGSNETKTNISSQVLPSSQSIPHTAILVTGAQLCSTAVNLNQIKDPACKALLGLKEERNLDIVETKNERNTGNTKYISSKTKYTSETLENQSINAELASARSKIFNKSENVAMTVNNISDTHVSSDDWTGKGKVESHNLLRKTMSASAKFSITPAWQKFPETGKTVEVRSKEHIGTVLPENMAQGRPTERALSVQEVVEYNLKKQGMLDSGAEGCIFSKDLPSFLVPNPPQSPRRHLEGQSSPNVQMSHNMRTDKLLQISEEKVAPFGIKLRRTHYSLRFHSDAQNEQKRKKRYSAGDSFEGVPTPFSAGDETEIRTLSDKEISESPTMLRKDSAVKVLIDTSNNSSESMHGTPISPLILGTSHHLSSPNKDRIAPKSPTIQKPSLAPKPSSPTPPSSPLSKLSKTDVNDPHGEKMDKTRQRSVMEEVKSSAALSSSKNSESLEHEKTDLPSIPWREKVDKRPEKTGRDRPVLQSRHSLDGTRLMEKVESAQPLWITLALQKQKGFREQQATRDERRQAREAKQADKLGKEITSSVQAGEYRSRSGSLQKPVPQEEKKCETVVTRLQRREQLQKSNTLPTSVTVEITETVPVPHAKDLPKRFSTPDATPASSEPAWLALAKRKSKAWSDCPQIIK
ncbi:capping protein-inhibiting regulator of actin dynamics isoform X2 [Phyllobates terribilis]